MVAVVIVLMVHSAVNGIRTEEINAESGEVELRVSEYFTKYMETTTQLAANNEISQLFMDVTSGKKIVEAERFDTVLKSMTNTRHTDDENILGKRIHIGNRGMGYPEQKLVLKGSAGR